MSVRKIPPNGRSITGHVPSKKKPGMLAFESQLERDLYILLEFDPQVREVQEQPIRIACLNYRGHLSDYTPDCEISYHPTGGVSQPPTIVEVKYRADLLEGWSELHPKLRAAMRYAKRHGKQFRVITERDIHGPRLQNARWLLGYRALPVPRDETSLIINAVKTLGGAPTVAELLTFMSESVARREELLVAIWHAIANGYVTSDLSVKLCMDSRIAAEAGSWP